MRGHEAAKASLCSLPMVLSFSVGCGGLDMQKHYANIRSDLVSHDYEAADRYVEEQKKEFYTKDNRLLYYMDRGMLLHLAKSYQRSNAYLEKASDAAEELWTESIGANAASWLVTDNSIPYQGEDFEKVAINIVSALNYVGLGDYEAARVEARQVTGQLERYNAEYADSGDDEEEAVVSAYRDDAFARWLSGKMRALEGTFEGHNEAWIEYRKALGIYSRDYSERYGMDVPSFVVEDALISLQKLGGSFREELEEVKRRFPAVRVPTDTDQMAEIVLVHLNGEAPIKVDKYWDTTAAGEPLRIAFPEFVPKNPRIVGAAIQAGSTRGRTELGEPWTAIAIQNLNDHMSRIKTKAIARAVTKYIAAKGLQAAGARRLKKKSDEDEGSGTGAALLLVGALLQATNYYVEEADKRSWATLPSAIHIGRLFVAPGTNALDVSFQDARGQTVEEKRFEVDTKAGETEFVFYRTYR